MLDLCRRIFGMASDLLRSKVALEAEILVLRQQINVLRRANPKRLRFVSIDRLILGGICQLFPKMYGALAIVRSETVIRWHRAGFRSYWRWKSKHRCGRPAVTAEIRQLIRQMSVANPLWGAPRIHGELLSYMDYYNGTRTHLSLNKDAPISRAAEAAGRILSRPILGGLHHLYARA